MQPIANLITGGNVSHVLLPVPDVVFLLQLLFACLSALYRPRGTTRHYLHACIVNDPILGIRSARVTPSSRSKCSIAINRRRCETRFDHDAGQGRMFIRGSHGSEHHHQS